MHHTKTRKITRISETVKRNQEKKTEKQKKRKKRNKKKRTHRHSGQNYCWQGKYNFKKSHQFGSSYFYFVSTIRPSTVDRNTLTSSDFWRRCSHLVNRLSSRVSSESAIILIHSAATKLVCFFFNLSRNGGMRFSLMGKVQ